MDTAGFAKDAYFLYRGQWSSEPMVHIVPMDWTSWQAGHPVAVWVYSNVAAVELFLNGRSLGVKSFDQKVTTFGKPYLETTEPAHDDYNYSSGSYTSPNGSAGKLHLTWSVPLVPGVLEAVAYSEGIAVARDSVTTAGPAHALALAVDSAADSQVLTADGQSVPAADVSYSGALNTIPAMMMDGNRATGWSNYYDKSATANVRAVSSSNASDWVSLSCSARSPPRGSGSP